MPRVNYCTRCKAEVPALGTCPHCGRKLAKSGERLSFGYERRPAEDWFSWNAILRVAVPVLALVFVSAVLIEAAAEGAAGAASVVRQGLPGTLLTVLTMTAGAAWLTLAVQGRETVRYVLDKQGAHAYTYLRKPGAMRLYARFLTHATLTALQEEAPDPKPEGLTFVRRADLRWADVKRAQYWPQTHTALLYRPRWWQAMVIRCDEAEYEQVTAMINAKTRKKRTTRRKTVKKR